MYKIAIYQANFRQVRVFYQFAFRMRMPPLTYSYKYLHNGN